MLLITFNNLKLAKAPIITILISKNPVIINKELYDSDAFIAAWLPGTEGGNGKADILFGDYAPTGK